MHITWTEADGSVDQRSDGLVRGMRNTIAVMNTKGGVGKSTLVLAIAETLSAQFRKNVLIIDSDSQASVSAMLLTAANLHRLQSDGLTIVDLLVASVLNNVAVDWPRFVVGGVSDVDEARTVYLGRNTLAASTMGLAGDDAAYAAVATSLAAISDQRDALAAQMIALLDGAEFRGQPLRDCDVRPLIDQADQLLAQTRALPR